MLVQATSAPKPRTINPMRPYRFDVSRLNQAPRCMAKSKRSGQRCRGPAVRGKRVCRMHGARGGAPVGISNGNYRHGGSTNDALMRLRRLRMLGRLLKCARRDWNQPSEGRLDE
jgi:hypothetical protein